MRKRAVILVVAALVLVVGYLAFRHLTAFPPDTTPEGAYVRIAHAIANGRPADVFPYLEEAAQQETFTIAGYANKASARIQGAYPAEAQQPILGRYQEIARAGEPPMVWAFLAERHGWVARLRRDLSGVADVEIAGDRATITTSRGTRYSFRRRPNGIWGLTLFTAELEAEAEKLARDWEAIDKAAADYERERGK